MITKGDISSRGKCTIFITETSNNYIIGGTTVDTAERDFIANMFCKDIKITASLETKIRVAIKDRLNFNSVIQIWN